MADSTVRGNAHALLNNPHVLAKLSELRARMEAQSTLAPNVTREFVLNGIKALALDADKDSTRLQAYGLLGKVVGIDLFRDIHVTEKVTRTVDDVERELKAKLTALQEQLTIDGDARQVEPAPADRRRKPRKGAGPSRP